MNTAVASASDGYALRRIVAFDVFRWNLRLGFAIAPRDMSDLRRQLRRRVRLSDVPPYLRDDIGLPPDDRLPGWHSGDL